MAFWLKKENAQKAEAAPAEANALEKKKAGDKKEQKAKRIDNLRIPQQLRVVLKSLGSQTEFPFLTKDLSATGAFVLCADFKRYPFNLASTILEATVELKSPEYPEVTPISFLAKVARIVEAHGEGAGSLNGFGIRIIQISAEYKIKLENFIGRHGHPDIQPGETLMLDDAATETPLPDAV